MAICGDLIEQMKGLKAERAGLQEELKYAPTGEKGGIASQIKQLNILIAAKQKELDACIEKNTPPPARDPFAACKSLHENIDSLLLERATLQEDLKNADPGQKAIIAAQIKKLNSQIAPIVKEFE